MKRFVVVAGILAGALAGRALSVESGYVAADVHRGELALSFGLQKIVEGLSFYTADKDWKPVFPRTSGDGYETTVSGTVITARAKANPALKVEQVFTITAEGFRADITAQVLPNSGAYYAVCDLFIGKPVFANASVRREGQPALVLDPVKWTAIDVDRVILGTPDGDWTFTVSSSGPAKWVLRSVCDRTWGPDEKKTFTFLNSAERVPAEGLTETLTIEARFVPRAGILATFDRQFSTRAASCLSAQLGRRGVTVTEAEGPREPAQRVAWLATRLGDASADLNENGLDPQAGVVIPAPKSCEKGAGAFRVPPVLETTCTPAHAAAMDVLSEDLARFGVALTRGAAQTAATPALVLGVPSTDVLVRAAYERLGLPADAAVTRPEGYLLAVTPETVLIAGADEAGVLYGAQTVRQLLRRGAAGAEIPVVTIRDWPDSPFRGFYVEGAGRVATSEELRRLIRNTYSYFKANAVVLELRWPDFAWASHPELASEKALPVSELTALADYARRYHLDVIPAVFTYGKVGDLVRKHPGIAEAPASGSSPAVSQVAYCPNKPETYALVFDLLGEIVTATQCRRLHIGHDEITGMAQCLVCKAIPPADLFANDVNRIAGWLAERHVETLIWGDFLLDRESWAARGVHSANSGNPHYGGLTVAPAVDKIRKDVIIADWHYYGSNPKDEIKFPTPKHFADKGFKVIGCPWHNTWNNYAFTRDVQATGQLGMLVTDWGFLATRSPGANSMVAMACAWDAAMPDPERLAWSPQAVFAASILRRDRPSRSAGATFAPVDLTTVANRSLAGTADAWFGGGARHGLVMPPPGLRKLFGVEYLICDRGLVVGQQGSAAGIPATSPRIAVNQPARSLVFLQTMAVDEPTVGLRAYGEYRVMYASGETAAVSIDGRNITHWLPRTPRVNPWMAWVYGHTWDAALAWEGCTTSGEPVCIQAYEWINPRVDDPIESVTLEAKQGVPGLKIGLVALTAVR